MTDPGIELQRIVTAHHEAGHLVASYVLQPENVRVTVSIIPDDERGLAGFSVDEDSIWNSADLEAQATILCAGWAAAVRYGEDPWRAVLTASDDYQRLRDHDISKVEPATARATALVEQHWREIQWVAAALLEFDALPGDIAETICDFSRGADAPGCAEAIGVWLQWEPNSHEEATRRAQKFFETLLAYDDDGAPDD